MKRFMFFLLLMLTLLWSTHAMAVAPTPTAAMVWAINVWDGKLYQTTFAPPASRELYLMAGEPATLRLTETEIYYWPLDRAYMANWLIRDETVPGTLEVWQGGRLVKSLEPEPFVIQSPSGDLYTENLLYAGDEATARFAAYMAEQTQYSEAMRAYHQLLSNLPANQQPPPQPVPPLTASTNPATGYLVDLPEGHYVLKVKAPNGGYITAAERDLTVFSARRAGTGYLVLPEERWTEPETSASPEEVIYAAGGATLYLLPHHVLEVPDQAYERMLNPQSRSGQPDAWRWVLTGPAAGPDLTLSGPAGNSLLSARPYKVEQVPGATLGYRILEATDPEEVAFTGYRVTLPGEFDRLSLALPADPTATRQIRQVRRSPYPWSLDVAVLALTLGAAAFTLLRRFRSPD